MRMLLLAVALAAASSAIAAPPFVGRFASPQQPWSSADGQVRLLRPLIAQPSNSQEPLGSLMASGWRLNWAGKTDVPGKVAIRLALPVVPASGTGQVTEVLQVGWSTSPAARRNCLSFGLDGGSRKGLPVRVINGVRFAAILNEDAGMSQSIDATDLRSVVRGRCYAVERFHYGVAAADRDPQVTLTQVQGAAMLDAALASLHIGPGKPLLPPHLTTPVGTVAL